MLSMPLPYPPPAALLPRPAMSCPFSTTTTTAAAERLKALQSTPSVNCLMKEECCHPVQTLGIYV